MNVIESPINYKTPIKDYINRNHPKHPNNTHNHNPNITPVSLGNQAGNKQISEKQQIEKVPHLSHLSTNHTTISNNTHSYTKKELDSSFFGVYRSNSPLHTLHSEWIDSPINSPSPVKNNMSVTVIEEKYETPKKLHPYITPITDNKVKNFYDPKDQTEKNNNSDEKLADKLHTTFEDKAAAAKLKDIKAMDIFWSMVNNVTGKDKMAKVGQYVIRLLLYHSQQVKEYLSDESINISMIDSRYNDRGKQLNLLRNFLKHPFDFARVVVILFASRFNDRFKKAVGGLGMYRQFLRFGKTPFRFRDIIYKVQQGQKSGYQNLFTKKFLGELIGFYYGFNDECLLLFKLGILTNKSFHRFVGRHESLAWYYDSILGIYNAVENINEFSNQEMELKIQIQVKNKARKLSKQILGSRNMESTNSNILIHYYNENSSNVDLKELEEIKFKKVNAYIDLMKWSSDFIFDSYTVFHMKLPFDTLQIWFGISASSLSTYKIYRETRRKLERA